MNIREVDLDERDTNRLQGIAQADTGMGQRGRINNNEVNAL